MPAGPRPRRQPTDEWDQLRLLVTSPEQEAYELLRPIVLFGQPIRARAQETAVPERSLRRKAARFASAGLQSLFAVEVEPTQDRRRLPVGIRRAIVELKAAYPPFSLREIAAICRERFDRPVDHHTVKQVLATEARPLRLPRRFRHYHQIPDPVQRRKAIVELYREGWGARAIAGYLATSRARVSDTLRRWIAEDFAGLADRSRAPHHRACKVDLKAMAAIRRLQANPELGEFRIHAALAQQGIHLSPRTCGRILALHRELGAPRPTASVPHEPQPMPFAAVRRHQYWSVDIRYIEDHQLGTGKPAYAISILENFSRALLASVVSPRQDLTAFLIVLRAAVEAHGAPEALVSDGGNVFKAKHARAISAALGIRKEAIDQGQPWQNYKDSPGKTTSRPTSTSCGAWPTSTTRERRPGPRCRRPTSASSSTTTTSRTWRTRGEPTVGAARRRCWAGSRAPGAIRPTWTASSGSAGFVTSPPAGPSAFGIGGCTRNGAWPASGLPSGSTARP